MSEDRPPPPAASTPMPMLRVSANSVGAREEHQDQVATEEPLELRVEGKPVAVMMRTPGHDEELAAGFLLTEGVVHSRADFFEIRHCPTVGGVSSSNVIDALLVKASKADLKRLTRHVFTASSCGICGKATIEAVQQHFPPVSDNSFSVPASLIRRLPEAMRTAQTVFALTGGLHAAALFDADGNLLHLREDVGRHNALDKVLGRALLDDAMPLGQTILLVSGRVSFEIVQKALAARIAIVAGVSAPSSLAVDFARESNQTLIGFLRDGNMNIYTHAQRIRSEAGEVS